MQKNSSVNLLAVILYEDADMMVINKPSGLTVNKSDTTHNEQTLQDWVESHLSLKREGGGEALPAGRQVEKEFFDRAGIVHRIDKETSGILLIAKNPESFLALKTQFMERTVNKKYLALVHGKVVPQDGEISVPIGRLPWNRRQFGVIASGREATTFYKVKGYYQTRPSKEVVSLVEAMPKTGRTHQIRVHMKYLGYPLVSDFLYAGRKTMNEDRKLLSRVFLHAASITFLHPTTKKEMTIDCSLSPELEDYITQHLEPLS